MTKFFKKTLEIKNIVVVSFFVFYQKTLADTSTYIPLSGAGAEKILPGMEGGDINAMLQGFYKWGVGIAVLIALVYIVIGGIQYMTTDAIYDKGEGRKKIYNAFFGLLIAMSSYLILNTINPDIVRTELRFDGLSSTIPDYSQYGGTSAGGGTGAHAYIPGQEGIYKELPPELKEYTLNKIREMGIDKLNPSDAADFFPVGVERDEAWLRLFSTIAKYESGHNPNLTYTENFKDSSGKNVVSTGLLQLSEESVRGYGLNYTTEDLKNPYKNIDAGLTIMKRWVSKDGVISGENNTGGARYWSVLRESGKKKSVQTDTMFGK